jgi:hypothetical protein
VPLEVRAAADRLVFIRRLLALDPTAATASAAVLAIAAQLGLSSHRQRCAVRLLLARTAIASGRFDLARKHTRRLLIDDEYVSERLDVSVGS